MNEKGLFYDGFATQRCEVKNSLDRERYDGNIADDVMATCATVDEVIEVFERYNLQFLENAMLFFGDANGDSVIIEGDSFVRKEGSYQVCTNFYQSITKPEDITCGRFKIANRMFEESPEISVDLFRRILAAVHIEVISPTQYSNVYDLKNRIVYLYHFHNYENVVKVDLMEELEKGAHTLDLPSLFPETFAAGHFKLWRENDMEKKRAERRDATVDPATFDDYTGSYVVFEGVYAGATFRVSRKEDTLVLGITGMDDLELIPEGKDRFFQIGDYGSQDLAFFRNKDGKVVRLAYEIFMRKIEAKKIRSDSGGDDPEDAADPGEEQGG
jgi:hypothetical protein